MKIQDRGKNAHNLCALSKIKTVTQSLEQYAETYNELGNVVK